MKKYLLTFISGIILGALVCFGIIKWTTPKVIDHTEELIKLTHEVDSLRTCISEFKPQIDTVYKWKVKLKYVYEEKHNEILNQSDSADWKYFNYFLCSRFPSDTTTTETN